MQNAPPLMLPALLDARLNFEPSADDDRERDGLARLERAHAGDVAAMRSVVADVHRCLHDRARGASAQMEVYLRIPRTPAALARYLRNQAIRAAAACLDVDRPWPLALELERTWRRFAACPGWVADIEHRSQPPADLRSKLRIHLWWATKHGGGEVLAARTLLDIIDG